MYRPDIVAIRTIYNEVEQGIRDSSLEQAERTFDYCEPGRDTRRVTATGANGRVRFYQREAGSDDSSLTWSHYYDELGRLRFVFITGGAVNGAVLEHRIYFGENQQRIFEQQKYTSGIGYTFPETWPTEDLQMTDPAAAFAASMPDCN